MGNGEATSVSELVVSTGGEPAPGRVRSKQDIGDARKNTIGNGYHQKKNVWTPKVILTPKFKGRIEELKFFVFELHGLDQ